jgi:hypothetical protein
MHYNVYDVWVLYSQFYHQHVSDAIALLRPKPLVRKLWIKYIINFVVHFVGLYIYIYIYIYILWLWLMHRRWDILKHYTCGCIPNKGCKIYVKLTTKGFEDIQCTAIEKNQVDFARYALIQTIYFLRNTSYRKETE